MRHQDQEFGWPGRGSGRCGACAVEEVTSTPQTGLRNASLRPLQYGSASKQDAISVPAGVTEKRRETNCRSRPRMFMGSAPHSAACRPEGSRYLVGLMQQFANRARAGIDREVGISVPARIGIGDGDAPEWPSRELDGFVIVVGIEQRIRDVAVTVRPTVYGDRHDIPVAGK